MGKIMYEMAEIIYLHITEQTLADNTILISNRELADTYQFPLEDVEVIIDGLIDNGYLLKLRDGFYSVKFGKLDEIKIAG